MVNRIGYYATTIISVQRICRLFFLSAPLFLDKTNKEKVVLIDASKLGTEENDGEGQKTHLYPADEQKIISAFNEKRAIDDFSVVLDYSLAAGQYFEIKVDFVEMTLAEFRDQITASAARLQEYFAASRQLETEILANFKKLTFGGKGE